MTTRHTFTKAQLAAAADVALTNQDRLHGALHINPVWRRVRAILFEPCRILESGYPYEDLQ